MKDILEKLLTLQDRDERLARLNLEQSRFPDEQAMLDRTIKQADDTVEQARAEAKRLESERKNLDVEAESKQAQVRKYKGQLLEIKNNDQFHALQHEIAGVEQEIRKIEDRELEIMEMIEVAQRSIKDAEARRKETAAQIDLQRKSFEQKKETVGKELAELGAERARLAADVDPSLLSRYERIFKSKHGKAIVLIQHGLCAGCHLKLIPAEIHRAQHGDEVVLCSNCGRILHWVPE